MAKPTDDGTKLVASNRKASHDYFLEDRLEAGIALMGSEIKSVRAGKVQLREAYVDVKSGQAYLLNAHISPYDPAARDGHDPLRVRRLLLHKKQIAKLVEKTQQKGYTIIPTRMYLSKGRAKVEIALAKGKRDYDKRQVIAERDSKREIERQIGRITKQR
jgi:SsrA-binding protein